MDLRQLRYFVAVAEELSFVRAAERLHMSQPPLSQQIKALEDEIGAELLFRTPREVRLTEAGRVFLEESRTLLDHAEGIAHRTRQAAGGEHGHIRVGMATSALFHVLPRLQRRLASQCPNVTLELKDLNSGEQVRALAIDKLDIGFIHARPELRGLSRVRVVTDTFAIVLPHSHRLASRGAVALHELADEPFVAFSREHAPALFDALIASCHQQGIAPQIRHVARHPASLLHLVRLGLGVSIVPRGYADEALPGLVFHHIPEMRGRLQIDAIWREGHLSAALGKVLDAVREEFAGA